MGEGEAKRGWMEGDIFTTVPLPCFRLQRRLCELSACKCVKGGHHFYFLGVKSEDLSLVASVKL